MRSHEWIFNGRYRCLAVTGTADDAARSLMNFVNVQGSGVVGIGGSGELDDLAEAVQRLDPTGSWRSWWARASGGPLQLSAMAPVIAAPPRLVSPSVVRSGRYVGVNVGGHFLRLVLLVDGEIADSGVTNLRRPSGSAQLSARDVVQAVKSIAAGPLDGVGIAWSAPRTGLGLRPMSLTCEAADEICGLMEHARLDSELSAMLRTTVWSCSDGEAIAAAEVAARAIPANDPLVVLKLGTSFASGLATDGCISMLPLQLSKCVLRAEPLVAYEHPQVGIYGTARDNLGAEAIKRTYRRATGFGEASFGDFCHAALDGDPTAVELVGRAAAAIAELSLLVESIWSSPTLIVTGKNVEDEDFSRYFMAVVRESLSLLAPMAALQDPNCDVDLCAARGAVEILWARLCESAISERL